MSIIMPPFGGPLSEAMHSEHILHYLTTVHPFATSWPSSPKGDARTLRDLLFCVIWHENNSADWLATLASPYPASPDFPRKRGQNKTPRNTLFINGSTVSTGYSAPACGGKVVAPATKGGECISSPARAVVKVLYKLAPSRNLEAPTTTL